MKGRIGETLEIPCKIVWDPKNKLTVQWLKNNVEKIELSGRFSKKTDGADNTLVIEDLEFGDKGKGLLRLPPFFCTTSQNVCSPVLRFDSIFPRTRRVVSTECWFEFSFSFGPISTLSHSNIFQGADQLQ